MWRRIDTPVFALVIAAVAASAFVLVELAHDGGDPGRSVRAGLPFADPAAVPPGLPVSDSGYDGQFYYRLALDPLTTEPTAFGITLDRAAYRQQRILYPAAAWAVSAADPSRVPAALIAVNLVAWIALAWLGARYAQALGRHSAWGLLFPLYPGFLVTVTHDLTELVGACVLLTGLLALSRARVGRAAAAFSVAPFARETALGVALAVLATSAVQDLRSRRIGRTTLLLLIPFAVAVAWQLVLAARWGGVALGQGTTAFAPPLFGPVAAVLRNESLPPDALVIWLGLLAVLVAIVGLTFAALRRTGAERPLLLAWLGYLALNVLYEGNIWSNPAGFLRADLELSLLGIAFVLRSTAGLRWGLAAVLAFGSALLAITHVNA